LGGNNHLYYPGADDNASGTAALLELAEEFSHVKELKYNLIFLATTGEEEGLLGSYYHANKEDFNPNNILINLNIDMIGGNDEDHNKVNSYLYAIGIEIYSDFKPVFYTADSLTPESSFDYNYNNGSNIPWFYRASDQYSFHERNIPAIFLFTGLHDDYHQPTDTPEKINYEVLTNRVRLISRVIRELMK
jgi:Zn-dependent M28 family amino/carboxypeptidase